MIMETEPKMVQKFS